MGGLEDNGIGIGGAIREDSPAAGSEPHLSAPSTAPEPAPAASVALPAEGPGDPPPPAPAASTQAEPASVAPVATAGAAPREAPFSVRVPPFGQSTWRDVYGDAYLAMRRRVADDALIADSFARLRVANRRLGGDDVDARDGDAVDTGHPSLGEYLTAKARQGLWYSGLGQAAARRAEAQEPSGAQLEALSRMSGISVDQLRANWRERMTAADMAPTPRLTEEAWRASPWYRDGLPYTSDMTERVARVRAEYHDRNQLDRQVIEDRHAGVFDGVLGFFAGMAGGAVDPINFLPGSAAIRGASVVRATDLARWMLGRERSRLAMQVGIAGGRAVDGFITGSATAMVQQALLAPSLARFGEEQTLGAFFESAFESGLWSAAISGALGVRMGGFRASATVQSFSRLRGQDGGRLPYQARRGPQIPLETVEQRLEAVAPFLRAANAYRERLDNLLRDATHRVSGAERIPARVKTPEEAADKLIRGERLRQPQELGDYLGGRIVVDRAEAIPQLVERLRASGRVVEVDNFLNSPRGTGYRAVHLQVRMTDRVPGFTAEVQIVPRGMADVADQAHVHYEHTRALPGEGRRTPEQDQIFDREQRAERRVQRGGATPWYGVTEPPIRVPRPAPQPPAQPSDDQDNPTR